MVFLGVLHIAGMSRSDILEEFTVHLKLNVFLTVHHELTITNYQIVALNIIYS